MSHTDLQAKCYEHDMVVLVTVVPVWSPCAMRTGASNYAVTFLTLWTILVESIPALLSCQYTSNTNMDLCKPYVAMATAMQST